MVACPAREDIRRYLIQDDSLSPDLVERIVAHIETCSSCQELLDELTDGACPPGTTMPDLPGYRIYKHLGAGAFGDVWLAQDLNLPRVVAAKTLKVGAAANGQARALEALRRDAHLLAQVEHPNVVRVYAWLTVHEQHYLVMQYVSGGSLADLLKSEGSLDWQRAARYVADVGDGLLEVHARGIVHRDVKPANILWDPRRDEAVLTDFGVGARLDDAAAVAGSIPYMAPEAFDGRVSPSLDVYSLAATFFHLVTGSSPFPSSRIADLKAGDPPGPARSRPAVRRPPRAARADHPRRPDRGRRPPARPEGVRLRVTGDVESAPGRYVHDESTTRPGRSPRPTSHREPGRRLPADQPPSPSRRSGRPRSICD